MAAQQVDDRLADRQAQPRGLARVAEQVVGLFLAHADAGIADRHAQPGALVDHDLGGGDIDQAAARVLAGIADQVLQHLAQAHRIEAGPGIVDVDEVGVEPGLAGGRLGAELVDDVADQVDDIDRLFAGMGLGRLTHDGCGHGRDVERILDHGLHRLGRGQQVGDVAGDVRIFDAALVQQARIAQDVVERGLQVGGDLGQEVRFGLVDVFHRHAGADDFFLVRHALGDVADDGDQAGRLAVLAHLDAALGADGAGDLVLAAQDLDIEIEVFAVIHGALELVDDQSLVLRLVDVELGGDARFVGLGRQAVDGVESLRPGDVARLQVDRPVADAGHFLDQVEPVLLRLQFAGGLAALAGALGQGDHGRRLVGVLAEQGLAGAVEVVARRAFADGQDAEDNAVGNQRDIGIEADLRRVEHGGFEEEAGVGGGVGDDHALARHQLALAEGQVVDQGFLGDARAAAGDQARALIELEDGHRRVEQRRRHFADRFADAAELGVPARHVRSGVRDVIGDLGGSLGHGHGKTFWN